MEAEARVRETPRWRRGRERAFLARLLRSRGLPLRELLELLALRIQLGRKLRVLTAIRYMAVSV